MIGTRCKEYETPESKGEERWEGECVWYGTLLLSSWPQTKPRRRQPSWLSAFCSFALSVCDVLLFLSALPFCSSFASESDSPALFGEKSHCRSFFRLAWLLAAGWRLAADSQQLTASELNTNFPCFVFKPPVVISNRISDLEASLSNRIASNDTGESICCF